MNIINALASLGQAEAKAPLIECFESLSETAHQGSLTCSPRLQYRGDKLMLEVRR